MRQVEIDPINSNETIGDGKNNVNFKLENVHAKQDERYDYLITDGITN